MFGENGVKLFIMSEILLIKKGGILSNIKISPFLINTLVSFTYLIGLAW